MKYIEYAHYDIASNERETKTLVQEAAQFQPDTISVLPTYLRSIKNVCGDVTSLSTIIDFPYGIMDLKNRLSAVETAIKNGANIIEIVAPSFFLCNRKYDKFREDIDKTLDICTKNNVELRYVLEYRIFTLDLMYKASQILSVHGINVLYPSSGHSLDNLSDNILACGLISKKIDKIQFICNGNTWNDTHAELLHKNDQIYGIKCHTLNGLNLIKTFIFNNG